jgi:hypothetical protein
MNYVETMLFWASFVLCLVFGVQMVVYWLIDKYTALNFILPWRILTAIGGTMIFTFIFRWLS